MRDEVKIKTDRNTNTNKENNEDCSKNRLGDIMLFVTIRAIPIHHYNMEIRNTAHS